METKHTINYLNKPIIIQKMVVESQSQFNNRLQYIKKLENANVDWKEANRLSIIWYCIKFQNCKYSSAIYHKVIDYDK